jgi:hypothetical protein
MRTVLGIVVIGTIGYASMMAVRSRRGEWSAEELCAALPRSVRQALRTLSDRRQERFLDEFALAARRSSIGWLLWLTGCHYLYARRPVAQVVYWATLGGLGAWALVDLVTMPAIMRQANQKIGVAVYERVRIETAAVRRYADARPQALAA